MNAVSLWQCTEWEWFWSYFEIWSWRPFWQLFIALSVAATILYNQGMVFSGLLDLSFIFFSSLPRYGSLKIWWPGGGKRIEVGGEVKIQGILASSSFFILLLLLFIFNIFTFSLEMKTRFFCSSYILENFWDGRASLLLFEIFNALKMFYFEPKGHFCWK